MFVNLHVYCDTVNIVAQRMAIVHSIDWIGPPKWPVGPVHFCVIAYFGNPHCNLGNLLDQSSGSDTELFIKYNSRKFLIMIAWSTCKQQRARWTDTLPHYSLLFADCVHCFIFWSKLVSTDSSYFVYVKLVFFS